MSEGPVTRIVLSDLKEDGPVAAHRNSIVLQRSRKDAGEVTVAGIGGSTWQLKVELPGVGITLLDDYPRELLHHSLRGFRFTARSSINESDELPRLTMALAVASIQLDCQLPRESPLDEVLLQIGVAARVDAISAQMMLSHEDLPVLHHASITMQEITLRLDEQVINTVAAVFQTQVADMLDLPRPNPQTCLAAGLLKNGLFGELHRVAREVSGPRVFVKRLRLNPVKLKLSWRSSRPDAPATAPGGDESERSEDSGKQALSDSLLGWLRWLGITLVGLKDAPVRLPEVTLQRAVLPVDSLLADLGQRYERELVSEVQKRLLTSAALLGDPYGTYRSLRQSWTKQWQKLRRTPWRRWPLVATQSTSLLLRTLAANMLSASGRSVLALSAGLEAFLSQESGQVAFPEALVQGVGGIARESARSLQLSLAAVSRLMAAAEGVLPASVRELSDAAIPVTAVQGLFLSVVLPLGVGRGLRRLAVLLALGTLRMLRSSADVIRGLLHSSRNPATPGRARPPRLLTQMQLVHPYRDSGATTYTRAAQMMTGRSSASDIVCCVEFADGSMLVMTRFALFFFLNNNAEPLWELKLPDVLLIQQQARRLRLLCLLPKARLREQCGSHMQAQDIELPSIASAEDLYESMRIACLNSRATPMGPTPPCPLLRSVLLPRAVGLS